MIDNFAPDVPSTLSTTPSVPYFSDFRGKRKTKKRAKKKKGKQLKIAKRRAEAAIWQAGYLSRENEILRLMILLSTAAERNRLNSGVAEVGMRLTGK